LQVLLKMGLCEVLYIYPLRLGHSRGFVDMPGHCLLRCCKQEPFRVVSQSACKMCEVHPTWAGFRCPCIVLLRACQVCLLCWGYLGRASFHGRTDAVAVGLPFSKFAISDSSQVSFVLRWFRVFVTCNLGL